MLRKSPKERLCDINDIKRHPCFSKIDWLSLQCKEMTPPYIPPNMHESSDATGELYGLMDNGKSSNKSSKSINSKNSKSKTAESSRISRNTGVDLQQLEEGLSKMEVDFRDYDYRTAAEIAQA
ncbi:MAG: hypothetical protein SGCHY_002541 [Lobulomycetales sp.]